MIKVHFEQIDYGVGVRNSIFVENEMKKSMRVIDFYHSEKLPPPTVLDGYILAILFQAMAQGGEVQVMGAVSRTALRNFWTLGEAWQNMNPEFYKPVEIVPGSILETDEQPGEYLAPHGGEKAVVAFSGGLDSHFSVLRHSKKYAEQNVTQFGGLPLGGQSFDLSRAVMVHGFDVKFENSRDFSQLRQKAEKSLAHLEVQLATVRTNIRVGEVENWEHSFGPKVASVLHQFSSAVNFGVIASGTSYSQPLVSWGSMPSIDHLFSGLNMTIVHDGAGFSRTEKTALICKAPELIDTIKVCWEGPHQAVNCGLCEKCVRTRLNFMAVDLSHPACFEDEFNMSMIDSLQARNTYQLLDLENILDYMRRNGRLLPEWATHLSSKIIDLREGFGKKKVKGHLQNSVFKMLRILKQNRRF